MKKSKILNIALTTVMLLSTILTPQMSHALANMQAEDAEETAEVEPTDTDPMKEEPAEEIDDSSGEGDSAEVVDVDGESEPEEATDETQPTEDDEVVSEEPEDVNVNSPPISTFNMGVMEAISDNLVTNFEMIINPGVNQIVVNNRDELEVNLDEMNALSLTYTLVKPNDVVVNPGDTYTIDLPAIFNQTLDTPEDITIDDDVVGTYILKDGQIVITFNAAVEDHDDVEMDVNISGLFDTTIFEEETEVIVNVPMLDGTEYEVIIRPEQQEYAGEDKKSAGMQYILEGNDKIEVTRNPEYIDWTIRANDNMGAFENATIIDDLGANLEIVEDSFVVERIIRNYNNEEIRRENVPVTPEMLTITSSGFELELDDIKEAYDITYTTRITRPDGGGKHTINNNARIILDDNEKKVQDDFTGTWSDDIPAIDKEGVISDDRADVIDWTVEYNFSKEQLGTVDLTDKLSHGEVIEDSIKVYQVETDIDGNMTNPILLDVEPVIDGNKFTIPSLDVNGKAYYIEFSSAVPVGLNDTVINTVSDNLVPNPNEDDASVPVNTIPTGGKVGEQDVDEEGNPYIEWTITMNSQKVDVGSINIIDVFNPLYLDFDVDNTDLYELYQVGVEGDDEPATNFDIEYYKHEDGREGFELTVDDAGPHEYKFVYRTSYTVAGMQEPELANHAELIFKDGAGIGIGDPIDVNFDLEGPKAGIQKSGQYVRTEDNTEQQIEWTVTFNQSKIMLDAGSSIEDIFTSSNIEYIDGSIKIVDENDMEFAAYEFAEDTFEINIGTEEEPEIVTRNGFTIQLTDDTNKTLTITYRTTTDDSNLANEVHENEATLNWQGGSETDDAEVDVRHPGINKSGDVVINGDGTKTVNWTINFNTNENIVHDFELVDTYTPTTVTISDIKITSGEDDVTNEFDISEPTDGEFTVSKDRLDAVPYQLTYSTTLSADEEKNDLVNTANITYTGGEDDASRTITKPTLGVQKEAVGEVEKSEDGDFINWRITANTDTANHLVNLVNPVLTDTIPSDQKLVEGSIEVKRVEDDSFTIEGGKIVENDNDFTIELPNGAYQYEVTFQTEILEYPSAHETNFDRYTNETTLSNKGYDNVSDDAYIDYFADGTNNNNTKEGVVNEDTENIDWTATVNPLGLTINNARIEDELSGNQTYLLDDTNGIVVTAGEAAEVLEEGTDKDYILEVAEDNRSFTISFNETITQPITVSYFTRLNPELIGNATVTNNLKLFGGTGDKELSSVTIEESTSQWTYGGGGSGRTLEFTLNKRSPSGEGVPNATFLFERYSTSGTLLTNGEMEITTGTDGTFEVKGARAGRYKVTEASTPEGYVLLTDPIYMTIGYANPADLEPEDSPYTIQITDSNWNPIESDIAQGVGDQLTIINEHQPISVGLEARKVLEGNKELEAGAFAFELVDSEGEVIQTKTNNADGEIVFDLIPYNTTGTFEYEIREVEGSLSGVTYDTESKNVAITVISDEAGVLSADVSYGEEIAEFVNTYQAAPTNITLEGSKVLTGQTLEGGQFDFEVVDTNDEENIVAKGSNTADEEIVFEPIEYTEAGTYEYLVREVKGTQGGMTYDSTEFKAVVTVTDDGEGQLAATVEYVDGDIEFTNSYEAAPTYIRLAGNKVLTGQSLRENQFAFEIVDDSDEETVIANGKNTADGEIIFEKIEYTEAGTYEYVVREVEGTQGGMTYDAAEFEVIVTVTDNGEGQLLAEVEYVGDEIEFTNTYEAAPTDVTLEGSKKLKGQALRDNQFTFEVVDTDDEENVIANGSNTADGEIVFEPIEYTEAGTYEYLVREVKGTQGGMTYDSTEFEVIVTVTDDGEGQLHAKVDYVDDLIEFANSYRAAPTDITLEGSKVLTGQDLRDNQFTFEVVDANDEENVIANGKNTADGEIIFETIEYTEAGTYEYVVREVEGTQGGMTYDSTEFEVIVAVTDDGEGQLHAKVDYVDDKVEFINSYQAAPTDIILEAKKVLEGQALREGQFKFELLDNEGNIIEIVENNVDGEIDFKAVSYNVVGEHTYTVREVKGDQGGVTYDETEHTVVVTIIDDGEGQLHAEANYGEDGYIEFKNTYETAPDSVIFEAEKLLNGRDLVSGEFEFELVDNEGNVLETVKNNGDGIIYFSEINYTEAGKYTYAVREVEGSLEGITYDGNVFNIIVTVIDDGEGQLTATIDYIDGSIVFENTYTEPEDPEDPEEPGKETPDDPEPEDPKGSEESDDDSNLPKTGEAETYTLLALILVGLGFGLRYYSKRRTN